MQATAAAADRDAAILALAPLVRRLALRVSYFASKNPVCGANDLESAGWIAAVRAVDAFDPTRGIPLEGYAKRVVLGAMFNELRRCDPVSERDRRAVRVGMRARLELGHELQREPTLREIETRAPGFVKAIVRCGRAPLSMNESPAWMPEDFVFDLTLEGKLASQADVAATVVEHERTSEIRAAIGKLDKRRRAVLEAHYFEERPLHDVAGDFKVSDQRASQLHLSALEQMRKHLAVVA